MRGADHMSERIEEHPILGVPPKGKTVRFTMDGKEIEMEHQGITQQIVT